jgi:hypothetical protein
MRMTPARLARLRKTADELRLERDVRRFKRDVRRDAENTRERIEAAREAELWRARGSGAGFVRRPGRWP